MRAVICVQLDIDSMDLQDRAYFFAVDPRKQKVIELRFFGRLSVDETASVLGISAQSVMRDGKLARAWLMAELAS